MMHPASFKIFEDPEDYKASFPNAKIELVLIGRGDFNARLTSVKLPNLHLLRSQRICRASPTFRYRRSKFSCRLRHIASLHRRLVELCCIVAISYFTVSASRCTSGPMAQVTGRSYRLRRSTSQGLARRSPGLISLPRWPDGSCAHQGLP